MRAIPLLLALTLTTQAVAWPGAPASAPTAEAKAQAKKRFDRALRLFEEGDNAGALAEFQRAWELTGNPIVLYDIGLVHDAMGAWVEADRALSEVLDTKPDPLTPAMRKRATDARARARSRIGTIVIEAKGDKLEGAIVELDGLEIGRWPLKDPIRAGVGKHVVGLIATGFAPARAAVSVAGEAQTTVTLELLPMEGKVAQLRVSANVPRANVIIDGVLVGDTPLPSSIAVAPGKHVIEGKRAGYATAATVLELTGGALGEARLDLREDPTAIAALGAKLHVHASPSSVSITIDGTPRDAMGPVPLPPGPHRLRVEAAGHYPIERDVLALEHVTTEVTMALTPTPETLDANDASIRAHRTWGFVGLGGGVALGLVSGMFFGRYFSRKSDIDDRSDAHNASLVGDGECSGKNPSTFLGDTACAARADQINADARANRTNVAVAGVAGGLALVSLGVGIWSLATTPRRVVTPTLAVGRECLFFGASFAF